MTRGRREFSCYNEQEWGAKYRCLAPVFIVLVEGTVKTLGLIKWTGLKITLSFNQSSLAHKLTMDEIPWWRAHLVFVQACLDYPDWT